MVDHPLDLLGCVNFDGVKHCDGFVTDRGLAIK